jgi:REP element-mobilizing transposase RayT
MDFHVMNRGARKGIIFSNDGDRALFVHLLGKYALEYEVKIVAWCLMDNHYHLGARGEGTPLYEMMRVLDSTYARAFNGKCEVYGCLFQGPFKSMAIPDADGLAYVSRYIHTNPASLGIRPEDYPWSSCRSYLGLAPVPAWLDPSPVMDHVGCEGLSSIGTYRSYLESAPPRPRREPSGDDVEDFHWAFLQHLESRIVEGLDGLNGSRGQLSARTLVCWAGLRSCGLPAAVLKKYFGYSNEGVVRAAVARFSRKVDRDPMLRDRLQRVLTK